MRNAITFILSYISLIGSAYAQTVPVPSIYVAQVKIATTGTAVPIGGNWTGKLLISVNPTNAAPICIGGPTVTNLANGIGNGFCIGSTAGTSSVVFAPQNSNNIWINGTAGDFVFVMSN